MAVTYVKDFSYPADFGFTKSANVRGYANGGSVKTLGSAVRNPPPQGVTNTKAAKSTFSKPGNTAPATKQTGTNQVQSQYSDYKAGGAVMKKYAAGGKPSTPKPYAKGGSCSTPMPYANGGKVEKKAMGGLSRGTSIKKNAAIHAKQHKATSPKMPSKGALATIAGALSGSGIPSQGPAAPPGMAPGMGAPPGGQMGAIAPQVPGMGAPAMAHGGSIRHVVVHHLSHKG